MTFAGFLKKDAPYPHDLTRKFSSYFDSKVIIKN